MKTLKWMAMTAFSLVLIASLTACGDDEPTPKNTSENSTDTNEGDNNTGNDPNAPIVDLTPEAHKERLTQIGKDFLSAIPQTDFQDLADLSKHIVDNYVGKSYMTEEIDSWAEECFKSLASEVLPEEKNESESSDYNSWSNTYSYYTSVNISKYTRRTYELSHFHAHLNWDENQRKWIVQSNTSDLQATCKDQNGQVVTLKLTASDKTQKVYVGDFKTDRDYTYSYYYDENGNYHSKSIYTTEKDRAYLEVPEEVNVTLTRGSETLVSVQVKTDLSTMSDSNFNLSKDAFNVTVDVSLAGYQIKNTRVYAKINDKVTSSVTVLKDGKELVNTEVIGVVNIDNPNLVWKEDADEDQFKESFEEATGNISLANINILGQLQVKIACSDLKRFAEIIQEADDYRYDESRVKGYVQDANNIVKAQFFYDNTNIQQGKIELECFGRTGSKGTKYEIEPVIVFSDGSRYSIANESYFNESNFKSLINSFENLLDAYDDFISKYIDD